ncbi:MAG: AFG1 family ATPase [Neisseriaceae bacterium]|nr:AFG1 family ATPase [Neisseriaceae bacterium]
MTHIFQAPSYEGHSPLSWYQQAAQQAGFIQDVAQKQAIEMLDQLWVQLIDFKQKRNRFLGRSLRSPVSPRGLYLWGGVGRGKSFLMDTFFGCLPYVRKKRVHFHAFMADIHRRLRDLKHEKNPMQAVAAEIAQEVRVLCFDEFHVSDIADAMILWRLLEGLFAHGVVLVATSNYAPQDLYPQGQNRSSFLPTIDLMVQNLTILNVDGGEDYRLRTLSYADVYFQPASNENERLLAKTFDRITGEDERFDEDLEILGRSIAVRSRTKEAVWLDFRTLCFTARSQQDYLYLAEHYRFVFISGIEKLSAEQRSEARRLTWLIDILYDYRVKLCATFHVPLEEIYTEGDFAEEFTRTVSRMQEMQSDDYLQRSHLTLENQSENESSIFQPA